MRSAPVFALLLAACPPLDPPTAGGLPMDHYFAFDGDRSWEFTSTDDAIPTHLVADLLSGSEDRAGTVVWTVEYRSACIGGRDDCVDEDEGWVRTVEWSSDTVDGTLLHGWDSPATGPITFSPPVPLTAGRMQVGETVGADVDGVSFTSTFVEIGDCPVIWTDTWEGCVHFSLEGGDHPLAGDYWAIGGWNVVGMALTGDTGVWQLSQGEHIPE